MRKQDFDKINEHKNIKIKDDTDVISKIESLLNEQDYAVLCSQGDSQVYSSLVGFSIDEDLKNIVFATPNYTRKYQLLSQCQKISMLIDNRSNKINRVSEIEAITIVGEAMDITNIEQKKIHKKQLLDKHPYLLELVSSDSCSIFNVKIKKYFYVTRIQEVYEWIPN